MRLRDYLGVPREARSIVIDTKPLTLLIVGSIDPDLIGRVKKTYGYEIEAFLLLRQFVSEFARPLVTTPNVLTEVSNHLRQGSQWRTVFYSFLAAIKETEELYVASQTVARQTDKLLSVGLADCTLINLLSEDGAWSRRVLLTEDGPLAGRTQPHSVNFTTLRRMVWALG